jgi:hypothetical protein
VSSVLDRYESNPAFAYYYRGLLQARKGQVEPALRSFREALVAELQRYEPDGMNLRLFRDQIRETEALLTLPRSPRRSPAPPPP